MDSPREVGGTQAIERALSVLEFVVTSQSPVGLSEITNALRLNRNTVYRLVRMLVLRQYLDVDNGSYTVGPMVIVLAQAQSKNVLLLRQCEPRLQDLSERTGECINLGILRGDEVFYLGRWEPTVDRTGLYIKVGQRAPLYASGLGKVFLASMSPEDRRDYYRRQALARLTPYTITNVDDLEQVVETVKREGFAQDIEEVTEAIRCVAVPLIVGGSLVAAISIAFPTVRYSPERISEYTQKLTRAAHSIADQIDKRSLASLPAR